MGTPAPWGHEFLVNTTTASFQAEPSITALSDGRFVVTWTDDSQSGGDTSSWAVRAQVFNADGSQSGAEFLVNTTTFNYQFQPAVTALDDGRFVVVWSDGSRHDLALGNDVRAQIFNADGSPSGAEFVVNSTRASHQDAPTVATLAGGGFVVVFADQSATGGDTSSYAIRAQVFNADGAPSGTEFLVNTTTASQQFDPSITALADGRFVVTWTDSSRTRGDLSDRAIRAQIFDPREAAVNLTGSGLDDNFIGTAFDDVLGGQSGEDWLVGRQGDDLLSGDIGNDTLFGRVDADTLAGGAGADVLSGGFGRDTFVFARGDGQDIVTDFQDGRDIIDLSSFAFAGFSGAAAHFSAAGADLMFTFGTQSLLIRNATLAQLDAADLTL